MSLLDTLKGSIEEEQQLSTKKDNYVNELYFATCNRDHIDCKIWRLNDDRVVEEIATRDLVIMSLAFHNNVLYDAGLYKAVFETLNDKKGIHEIVKRKGNIYTLCSHKGILYDAGDYEGYNNKLFMTLENKALELPALHSFSYISKLYSDQKTFYGIRAKGGIFDLLNNICVEDVRPGYANDLCVHKGRLYYGGVMRKVIDAKENTYVAARDHIILALCSHNGMLLDAGNSAAIFDTFSDEKICECDDIITAMCSVRRRIE